MFGKRKKKKSAADDPLFEQPKKNGRGVVISEEPALKRGEAGHVGTDTPPADAPATSVPETDTVPADSAAADTQGTNGATDSAATENAPVPPPTEHGAEEPPMQNDTRASAAEEMPPLLDDEDLAGLDFIFAQADPPQEPDGEPGVRADGAEERADIGDIAEESEETASASEDAQQEPLNALMPIAWSDFQGDRDDEDEKEEAIDFVNLLKDTDASDETPAQKRRRLRAEAKAKERARKAAARDAWEDTEADGATEDGSAAEAEDEAYEADEAEKPREAGGTGDGATGGGTPRVKRSATALLTRKSVRKVLSIAAAVLVFALLLTGFLSLRTQRVIFRNLSYYNPEDIVAACGIQKNSLLPLFRRNAYSDTISSEFPFIRSVSASIKLPGTLILTMEEDAPAYYIVIHDEYFLISTNQRVLARYKTREELPDGMKELMTSRIFYAVVGHPLVFFESTYSAYLAQTLLSLEEADIYKDLTKIDITYRYDINLYYKDALVIEIGSTTDLSPKLQFVNSILADLAADARGTIHIIDVKTASVRLSNVQPTA